MDIEILRQWQDLIFAAEALAVGGEPLVFEAHDLNELKQVAMAMVIYNSRLIAQRAEEGFALDVHSNRLYIYKIFIGAAGLVE